MGSFNWPELRELVTSIVGTLSKYPPYDQRSWGDGWIPASVVRDTLLGSWGPQVDEAEFDVLVDELVDGCVLDRTQRRSPLAGGGTWTTVLLRPMKRSRTEATSGGHPPG